MLKTYTSEVVEILPNGDAIIQFPPELMEELGWKEGDTVSLKEESGKIVIKKVNTPDKNNSLE